MRGKTQVCWLKECRKGISSFKKKKASLSLEQENQKGKKDNGGVVCGELTEERERPQKLTTEKDAVKSVRQLS